MATSTFSGLGIALSALGAQQRALDVTSHNISNVNTPGYKRQVLNQAATAYDKLGMNGKNVIEAGTGVEVQEIKQIQDEFLDRKIQRELSSEGYWNSRKDSVEELETSFNDMTQDGLQVVMDNFWNSWEQAAKPAGGLAARALVKENALALIENVKYIDETLTNFKKNKDAEITEKVDLINKCTKGIADLNQQIQNIEKYGVVASDLRDQRNKTIEELSSYAKVAVYRTGKVINIALEGRLIVESNKATRLSSVNDPLNNGMKKVVWSDNQVDISFESGQMFALFEARDRLVSENMERVNQFIKGLTDQINILEMTGYGLADNIHRPMFLNGSDLTTNGITLKNVIFNPEMESVDNIALGAQAGAAEDNSVALGIANLRNKEMFGRTDYPTALIDRKYTADEFYRNIIADLGNTGMEATSAAKAQSDLVAQIVNRRDQMSSVSLDEEMADLIRYQHSYDAAARMVNAIDEMVDIIVNRLGVSGR